MDKVTTGNPQLDEILGGGLPRNSLTIVAGAPDRQDDSSQQFVFANATPERPVAYLTTLSEPGPKLLRYLQEYPFFDEEKLFGDPPAIVYHDIAAAAKGRGFEAVPEVIGEIIREHNPAFLVVDSFKALRDLGESSPRFRQVLFDLAGTLAAYACTTLLIGEYSGTELDLLPEFAVADGIIHLVNQKHGVRDERYLRVVKLRGSGFRSGEHAFRINEEGLSVFPRLVTPERPITYSLTTTRMTTGVPGLDAAIGGGLLRGSSTLLAGQTGSGKTILTLHFLFEGIERGEPGLLLSFQESPTMMRRNVMSLGFDVTQLDDGGQLTYLYVSPVELNIDDVMQRVVQIIERNGIRRLGIDSLADMQATASDDNRFRSCIYSMLQLVAAASITTIVTLEAHVEPKDGWLSSSQISYLCDNVFALGYDEVDGKSRRRLVVIKTRGSQHDARVHGFVIDERGVHLTDDDLRVIDDRPGLG